MEWLAQQEPALAFDPQALGTDAEWIAAGEAVFDAPIGYGATFKLASVRDPRLVRAQPRPGDQGRRHAVLALCVRKKGVVEAGSGSCLMCHARVMPDGTLLKGAQGNFPADRIVADNLRQQAAVARGSGGAARRHPARTANVLLDAVAEAGSDRPRCGDVDRRHRPCLRRGAGRRVDARNLSLFTPAQIPDLIGLRDRRFLDHTGLVQQRSIADLMRYVAIVQGANAFDRFGDFLLVDPVPDPTKMDRYSDEQLYALARYLYSLTPPPNPNTASALSERGRPRLLARRLQRVSHRAALHEQQAHAGDRLPRPRRAPAALRNHRPVGRHRSRARAAHAQGHGLLQSAIAERRVVRGPFQHAGAVKTLDDWFDPARPRRVPATPSD